MLFVPIYFAFRQVNESINSVLTPEATKSKPYFKVMAELAGRKKVFMK